MGLVSIAKDSITSLLEDQWREYFYCDSMSDDVLMVRGVSKFRGKGNKGSQNVISNGSVIVVNEGQCMLIVDQGGIVDFCAEPGPFVYDTSSEPSLLYGNLGENIKESLKTVWDRFTFAGNVAKDQRVYFINMKNIKDNYYGTPSEIRVKCYIKELDYTRGMRLKCNGKYVFAITDPLTFYKKVGGNITGEFRKDQILGDMKEKLLDHLQQALTTVAQQGIAYYDFGIYNREVTNALKEELTYDWKEQLGIEMVDISIKVIPNEEDEKAITEKQDTAVYSNERMQIGRRTEAMGNYIENASMGGGTGAGADPMNGMMSMMAMNMMTNMMNQGMPMTPVSQMAPQTPQAPQAPQAPVMGWTCTCGKVNQGRFCQECGSPKPTEAGWTCTCGAVNQGKFCQECGKPKPAGAPLYRCDKCGWEPEDPMNPPKFCQQCGDRFDESDIR